jgi:hypothetical protein
MLKNCEVVGLLSIVPNVKLIVVHKKSFKVPLGDNAALAK